MVSRNWISEPFTQLQSLIYTTQVSQFILQILLGFLLFAGALHTSWSHLRSQIKQVSFFALIGVILSTAIVASLFYFLCQAVGYDIDFLHCLIFGALISPTDPVAVISILTKAGVSKRIETIIVGESLFNDGVGVVLFVVLLSALQSGTGITFSSFSTLFLKEAVGGVVFGLGLGFLLHFLLRSIDHYGTEVILSVAFVMAGYSIAGYFHLSGPLAVVVMGLLVGNYKQKTTMSDISHQYMLNFWEVLELILNAILFIIVPLVMTIVDFNSKFIIIGLVSIFIILLARIIVVYFPSLLFKRFFNLNNNQVKIVVWGGLKGGLSLALALSVPPSPQSSLLVVATYICVIFSILVQGLTVGKLAGKK